MKKVIRKITHPATITLILLTASIGVLSNLCIADSLVLTDNQTLSGRIIAEQPELVTIETPQGKFTFPRSRIKRIIKESAEQNRITQLQAIVKQGNLDQVFQFYETSEIKHVVSEESLSTILLNGLGPIAANVTATSHTVSYLTSILDSRTSTPAEISLLAASLNMDYGLEDQAVKLLTNIPTPLSSRLSWPPHTISSLLSNIAGRAMESGNGVLLAQTTRLVNHFPVTRNTTISSMAVYQAIRSDIRAKQYLVATTRFQPDLFLYDPKVFIPLGQDLLTAIQSEANRESGQSALESARTTIVPYMPPEIQQRALKHLVASLIASANMDRAQRIADDTSKSNPDLGALLQHLIDFKKRYPLAQQAGPVSLYKLGSWAKDMGLNEEARAIFISLRSDPRFLETVNLQIRIIENTQAAQTVKLLRNQFRTNQFSELERSVHQFLKTNPPEAYAQEARGLMQLTDFQKWSTSQTDARKAEIEFQNAERLAQQGNYDAATDQLNKIQIDSQETRAAQKAQELRQKIIKARQRELITSQTKPKLP